MVKRLLTTVLLFMLLAGSHPAAARPTVALVLGGGAARGFSHIGIIKALEESGIPIDMLVGTSMGSIVAGLYAAGYSTDNMAQVMAMMDAAPLFEVPFPIRGGLLSTQKIQVFLDELLEGKEFSDLSIPFYSVVSELRTGDEAALHTGAVSTAIRASMSIPGMFPPVRIGDHYYVDGGMKNAVPVDVARRLGADVVIGVDVKKDLAEVNYSSIINNLQLTLWFMTDGYVQAHMHDADVVITPDVMYDSYMDYQRDEYFIRRGYEAGMAAVVDIKRVITEKDPQFVFSARPRTGLSAQEMARRVRQAMLAAMREPGEFSVKPVFLLSAGDGMQPGLGVAMSGGPLEHWRLGYIWRAGLDTQPGSHELSVSISRPPYGVVELYGREYQHVPQHEWGVRYTQQLNGIELRHVLSVGDLARWETTLTAPRIWQHGQWLLSSRFSLMTEAAGDNANAQKWVASASPEVLWYTTAGSTPVMEFALARPYLYAGLKAQAVLKGSDSTPVKYRAGAGISFRLFGLYPVDARAGVTLADGKTGWTVEVRTK